MRDELVGGGVDADRVLVNPNAVDPDRYTPDVDGGVIRRRLGLEGTTVLGFISTFQPWHGAVVLARAFAALLARSSGVPRLRPPADDRRRAGAGRSEAGHRRRRVRRGRHLHRSGRAGGRPAYLAACDILVSPHVPNADGTPFFGSPTKLFEYMAMGKGIVASDLDQIGEVLRHGETAWLVPPADADALADGHGSPGARSGVCAARWARRRGATRLRITPGTPTCNGRSTRWTHASTPAPHDGEAPARDQLGHAAALRTARGAGEPDAQASRAARVGIVGRLLRSALVALQPGSPISRRGSGRPTA